MMYVAIVSSALVGAFIAILFRRSHEKSGAPDDRAPDPIELYGVARWDYDTENGSLEIGADALGFAQSSCQLDEFLALVFVADREKMRTYFDPKSGGSGAAAAESLASFRLLSEGSLRWLEARTNRSDTTKMSGILLDITDYKNVELELLALLGVMRERIVQRTELAEKHATQLRILAADLTQAEQRERRRLAQLLHDHLQQLLVAAKLRVGLLDRCETDEIRKKSTREIQSLIAESIEASRTLTVELSPPVLADAGLVPALGWMVRWMKKNHSLIVHVDATADAEPDSEEVRYFLFQALRELLFNVVKHAAVSEATITLQGTPDEELRMVVEDEGCGFRTDAVQDEDEGEHFGLFSIQQRLALLGGTMFVDSKPDRGTRITLRVPRQQPNTRTSRPVASLSFRSTAEEESVGDVVWTTARPNPSIRVLLADDHDLLREGVARLLGEEQDIKVVGEASDGEEAVRIFKELRPDVVVMDITMPKVNGIAATTQIKEVDPDVRIIGLSMHTVEDMSAAMRSAGADAYLTKGGASETLVRAIRGDVPAAKQRRPTRPGGWLPN